jgi:hypothetical protein
MAAANTYVSIATQTLGSAAASVTFSSIPATYTDLVLVVNGCGDAGSTNMRLRFNSDTASNYSDTWITGDGATATSSRTTSVTSTIGTPSGTGTTLGASTIIFNIMNYANATTYKTIINRASTASLGTDGVVSLWRSTTAINSITIGANGGFTANFKAGSVFSLYGILAA